VRRTVRRTVCGLLAAGILAGCLSRSPRPAFYRLASNASPTAPVASRPELGLAVGPIDFPRYLDRPEIVARDGAHGLTFESGQRWGSSLRSEVQRVVADDLAALLGTSRVAVYPVKPRFPVTWRILLDVRSFEGVRGESVVLRARWVVASGTDGHAAAVEESVVEQRVTSDSWGAYVAAQSAALGEVTREIAEQIAALPTP